MYGKHWRGQGHYWDHQGKKIAKTNFHFAMVGPRPFHSTRSVERIRRQIIAQN